MRTAAMLAALACAAAPLSAAAATHTVTVEGMQFRPAQLVVRRGDRITWVNRDVVPHTATAGGRFDSGRIAAGKRWTWAAAAPGSYEYVCTYHPGMSAKVEVR